jgi:protein tyrosine/serine phosphatase
MKPKPPQLPIRNFQAVTDWLYRGGQPEKAGLQGLSELGVKTIISLRSGRVSTRAEAEFAESLGMQLIHMPITYFNLPDAEFIDRFLQLLDNPDKRPIFVHCLHGADRTGYLIAVFRITRMNWPVQQAYNEMKSCGFHRFRLRHFKWELWDYARRIQRAEG